MWRIRRTPPGSSFRRDQTVALASPMCVGPDRKPIMHLQRIEVPEGSDLTGWLLASGEESNALLSDASAWLRVSLPSFIREDPTLAPIVDSPVKSEWTRNKKEMIWRRIVEDKVVDASGGTLAEFGDPKDEKTG
jgi:hypothetical protein